MKGRILTVTFNRHNLDEMIKVWPEFAKNHKGRGLVAMYLFLDKNTCQGRSITIWESEELMKAAADRPDLKEKWKELDQYYAAPPQSEVFDIATKLVLA